MMKQKYQELYVEMLQEIETVQQLTIPENQRAETCFWIAHDYWNRLKKLVCLHGFDCEDEEIDFFKNTKPMFTAYIKYFLILSESLMFVPGNREEELIFWTEEQKRYDRFVEKHKVFIGYYEQGQTKMDHLFFLRRNAHPGNEKAASYDSDNDFTTGYDQVLGNYLGFKKYLEYISCRKLLLH